MADFKEIMDGLTNLHKKIPPEIKTSKKEVAAISDELLQAVIMGNIKSLEKTLKDQTKLYAPDDQKDIQITLLEKALIDYYCWLANKKNNIFSAGGQSKVDSLEKYLNDYQKFINDNFGITLPALNKLPIGYEFVFEKAEKWQWRIVKTLGFNDEKEITGFTEFVTTKEHNQRNAKVKKILQPPENLMSTAKPRSPKSPRLTTPNHDDNVGKSKKSKFEEKREQSDRDEADRHAPMSHPGSSSFFPSSTKSSASNLGSTVPTSGARPPKVVLVVSSTGRNTPPKPLPKMDDAKNAEMPSEGILIMINDKTIQKDLDAKNEAWKALTAKLHARKALVVCNTESDYNTDPKIEAIFSSAVSEQGNTRIVTPSSEQKNNQLGLLLVNLILYHRAFKNFPAKIIIDMKCVDEATLVDRKPDDDSIKFAREYFERKTYEGLTSGLHEESTAKEISSYFQKHSTITESINKEIEEAAAYFKTSTITSVDATKSDNFPQQIDELVVRLFRPLPPTPARPPTPPRLAKP